MIWRIHFRTADGIEGQESHDIAGDRPPPELVRPVLVRHRTLEVPADGSTHMFLKRRYEIEHVDLLRGVARYREVAP